MALTTLQAARASLQDASLALAVARRDGDVADLARAVEHQFVAIAAIIAHLEEGPKDDQEPPTDPPA